MPYDTLLADRVREYLTELPKFKVEEKEIFRRAFLSKVAQFLTY